MDSIENKIAALEFEREGCVTFEKEDRVKEIDKQLEHWRGQLEKQKSAGQKRADAKAAGPEDPSAKPERTTADKTPKTKR